VVDEAVDEGATTQAALGKTSDHSAKGLLVVMIVLRFSWRLE